MCIIHFECPPFDVPLAVSRPLYSTSKGVFIPFLHRLSYHSTTRLSHGFLHTKKSYRKIALYFSNCFNISTLVFTFETELIKSFKASPSIRITWLAFANSWAPFVNSLSRFKSLIFSLIKTSFATHAPVSNKHIKK